MLFVKECRAAQNARFCSGGYAMMSRKNRTRQEMEEEMRQLRKVFMTVRLMKADEVQGGKKGSAPCYAQWRRSRPCENCVARQALEKNTRKTRLEYFGQELYEITASCVQVDGQLCVLELTRKIDRSVLLDPENGERLLNSITDEREKRYRDPLTGAYNRTYYDENYRYRSITAGVAMLDMDDLKFSNDVYGSGAGNSVLETQHLAEQHPVHGRVVHDEHTLAAVGGLQGVRLRLTLGDHGVFLDACIVHQPFRVLHRIVHIFVVDPHAANAG